MRQKSVLNYLKSKPFCPFQFTTKTGVFMTCMNVIEARETDFIFKDKFFRNATQDYDSISTISLIGDPNSR